MQRAFDFLKSFPLTLRKRGEITSQFLTDASDILASSLDYQTTLNSVVRLATGTVADWCLIDLLNEDGTIRRVAVAHHDPAKEPLTDALWQRSLINPQGRHTILKVLKGGEPFFDPDVSAVRLRQEARDEQHWRLLKELGFRSEIVVPLIAREKALGTLTLVLGEGRRRYKREDVIVAQELARRVALAIDNAQLYQEAETQRQRFEVMMTRYRDLVETANDIIYTLDMAGNLTSINRAGEEILGYKRDELLNAPIERLVLPAYHDRMNQMQDQKIETGGRTRYELEILTKAGQPLTLEVNSQLMMQGKTPVGIQGIARDITERKQAEKRAEHLQTITTALYQAEQTARLQAEEANHLKLQFLAMISHELRTPLTSIKGFTSTLLAEDVIWDAAQQRDFLQIVDQEADKLAALIDELLDLSGLHAGKLSISPDSQSLLDIIQGARVELQALTQQHNLTTFVPDDLPPVRADTGRIAQILTNLVSNAAKYSPPATTISITAHHDGDSVQIDITDEGIGIPLSARDIVFEAFKQGSGEKKGAGLGLAICKGLVEAHNGRIWIQDHPPPGTTISFTLPIASASQISLTG